MSDEGTERFTEMYGEAAYMYIFTVLGEGAEDHKQSLRVLHRDQHDSLNFVVIAAWKPRADVVVLLEFYNGNFRGDGIETFVRYVPWLDG